MFRAAALVPSPPLLVPELTGRASVVDSLAGEVVRLRDAARAAVAMLGTATDRWIVIGSAEKSTRISSRSGGTFAGYGVDVRVGLSADSVTDEEELPLAALIAGWLRGEVAPQAAADVVLVGTDTPLERCRSVGEALRAEMDEQAGDWGLLVVADGATTLTAKAPGSFDARAEGVQSQIDDALARADTDALASIDRGLCAELGVDGWEAWQTLAGVVGARPMAARTLYRGAPFGVGYFVGTWEPLS
nr:class III extradiol dioxygenase subunit B-like domain-containing protein [Rhodococcus sp. (in: high G+C Gram-positive bacteria)]